MGKGPKGSIWYAGEGEQDQNYLTQLVLQTWEESSIKANYFQANRQWFSSQNTMKNDTEKWERGVRIGTFVVRDPNFAT